VNIVFKKIPRFPNMAQRLAVSTEKMHFYATAYRKLRIYTNQRREMLETHLRTRIGGLRGFIKRDRAARRALIEELMRTSERTDQAGELVFPTFDELVNDPMPLGAADVPLSCVTLLIPYFHNH
jgi:hypothetical protein